MEKTTKQKNVNIIDQDVVKNTPVNSTNTIQKDNTLSQHDLSSKTKKNIGFEWLTEHSRNFLAAGYIQPGLKAEIRIREIADRAEELLGIKGYSDKFYNYM